jgi:hypothetical protein
VHFVDSVRFGSTLSTFRTDMVQFVNRSAAGPALSTFRTLGARIWRQVLGATRGKFVPPRRRRLTAGA